MEIIKLHHNLAKTVNSWRQIRSEAKKLQRFVEQTFNGKWKVAVALSHAQVSDDPFRFFVIGKRFVKSFNNYSIFINAEIIKQEKLITFSEACMTFQDRNEIKKKRYDEIWVKFQIPTWYGGLKTIQRKFTGLGAYGIQHEVDHSNGINIYSV